MPLLLSRLNLVALAATTTLSLTLAVPLPAPAQIDTSTATFNEALQAVKDKNFRHAVELFSLQAESNQHDAQYNLAILLEAGKGAPQDFTKALIWAWLAQLGGIEAAKELADDLSSYLPEKSIEGGSRGSPRTASGGNQGWQPQRCVSICYLPLADAGRARL